MYKLLITDDEPAVRKYLRYIVQQYNLPFYICGEAEDGEQAVRIAALYQPEFIIMDINMPLLNGLEAAKIIRQKQANAIIYILTAYSEFTYAQTAVQTNVSDYLLKPIKPEQLANILRKGIAKALSLRIAQQKLQRLEQQIAKDKPVVTQQRLLELLQNDNNNSQALQILRNLSKKEHFLPAAVLSVVFHPNKNKDQNTGLTERLLQEACALFGKECLFAAFAAELVVIFPHWDFALHNLVQNSLTKLEKKYALTICAGVSTVPEPGEISSAYQNACQKRKVSLFWRQQKLVVIAANENGQEELACEDIAREIQLYLLERQLVKAKAILHKMLLAAQQSLCPPSQVQNALMKIGNILLDKYAEYILPAADAALLRKKFSLQLAKAASALTLEHCLSALLEKLEDSLGTAEQNQAEQAVRLALEHINNNYQHELTLEYFAEKSFMSTGHFCRSFKKYAGEGYAAYLTNIRLAKALEILLTGNYTVAEVARMVGFRDASYFSSVFKKHYQQSPSSFAAQLLPKET